MKRPEVVNGPIGNAGRPPVVRLACEAASRAFGVPVEHMRGLRRTQGVVRARFVAYLLAREGGSMTAAEIGRLMRRDHTTVLLGCARARVLLSHDPDFERRARWAGAIMLNRLRMWREAA